MGLKPSWMVKDPLTISTSHLLSTFHSQRLCHSDTSLCFSSGNASRTSQSAAWYWGGLRHHLNMSDFTWRFPKMETPKSSILIGFSVLNHPFWCPPIVGNLYRERERENWILATFSLFGKGSYSIELIMQILLFSFSINHAWWKLARDLGSNEPMRRLGKFGSWAWASGPGLSCQVKLLPPGHGSVASNRRGTRMARMVPPIHLGMIPAVFW